MKNDAVSEYKNYFNISTTGHIIILFSETILRSFGEEKNVK